MKRIMINIFCLSLFVNGFCQTTKEWLQQEKTQIEYLVKQIARLRLYAHAVKQGYETAGESLSLIHEIKTGDLALHSKHFSSLMTVSPQVSGSTEFKTIQESFANVQKCISRIQRFASIPEGLSDDDRAYISKVVNNVRQLCQKFLVDIEQLTTNNRVSLSDDERINRIGKAGKDIADALDFSRHFEKTVQLLAVSRLQDKRNLESLRKLYGLK